MLKKKLFAMLVVCAMTLSLFSVSAAASTDVGANDQVAAGSEIVTPLATTTNVVDKAGSLGNNLAVSGTFKVPAFNSWNMQAIFAVSGAGTGSVWLNIRASNGTEWSQFLKPGQSAVYNNLKLPGGVTGTTYTWSIVNQSGGSVGYSLRINR